MNYQFASIKSVFNIKRKQWLTGISFFLFVVGGAFAVPYLLFSPTLQSVFYLLYFISIIVMLHIFIKVVVDKYKITGTVIFDNEGIFISESKNYIKYSEINRIYYIPSSMIGSKYPKSVNTYLLQIITKESKSEMVHVTRNQYINDKLKNMLQGYGNLFSALEETEIEFTFKSNKYYPDER